MSNRPEPHRDHRTIGSFKRTANAALLIWVTREPAPQQTLRPARLLLGAAVATVVVLADLDLSTTLPSLGSAIGL